MSRSLSWSGLGARDPWAHPARYPKQNPDCRRDKTVSGRHSRKAACPVGRCRGTAPAARPAGSSWQSRYRRKPRRKCTRDLIAITSKSPMSSPSSPAERLDDLDQIGAEHQHVAPAERDADPAWPWPSTLAGPCRGCAPGRPRIRRPGRRPPCRTHRRPWRRSASARRSPSASAIVAIRVFARSCAMISRSSQVAGPERSLWSASTTGVSPCAHRLLRQRDAFPHRVDLGRVQQRLALPPGRMPPCRGRSCRRVPDRRWSAPGSSCRHPARRERESRRTR